MGKVMGVFVLVVIAIPVLIGVIFATGLTRAATSPDFYTDLSGKVLERLPVLIEKTFEAANQPGAVEDPDTRAWVEAMHKADTRFPDMLKKTGIQKWLDEEVAGNLQRVGKVMTGEIQPDDLSMDMRPLKAALASQEMTDYLKQVLVHLPACDEAGLERWKQRLVVRRHDKPLPACNPGDEAVEKRAEWTAAWMGQIPDEKPFFPGDHSHPVAFDAFRWVNSVMWLLFLLPALFIAIGAGFAGRGGKGFLRYSSGTLLAGGGFSWLLSGLASGWLFEALKRDPSQWSFGDNTQFLSTQAGQAFVKEMSATMGAVMNDLFSPVVTLSWIVCAVGAGLLALSFLVGRNAPA
jgi:hypothetical protein